MSAEGLDALRVLVARDPVLARRLRALEPHRFVEEILRLAPEMGFDVARADVEGEIAHGRMEWTLRWVR